MLGQIEPESAEIVALANELLEPEQFQIKTVASDQIVDYYQVADAFVLASLGEGFGRVLLEAMSYGLPCLAHDYEVSRFVLKDEGYFGNFELAGSLTSLISDVLSQNNDNSKLRRHQSVYERFSWDKIRSKYVDMIYSLFIKDLTNA
jgi:glycosyltransferase involved in cell wall biosynthesis